MKENLTRHDRRKDRTRHQLQNAMLDLVLERGYEDFVIQDITDRADVGRGTFYFHFDSKHDVMGSIVEERFTLETDFAERLFGGELPDQAEFYSYVNRFKLFEKNKNIFLAVLGGNGSQAAANRVRRAMVTETMRDIEKHHFYQEVGQPAEITAQIVVGLATGLAVWWLETPNPYTAVQMGGILYQTLHHREPPGGTWQEGVSG